MFLARRDDPGWRSPKPELLRLLSVPSFRWLWSTDFISDYEQGAQAIAADERILRRAVFDRLGFELFLETLRLVPAIRVSAATMRKARRRIEQAPCVAERDLEDAVYLACAVVGDARLIMTEDSDLRALGSDYEGVLILSWGEFLDYLRQLGLPVVTVQLPDWSLQPIRTGMDGHQRLTSAGSLD